jgi:hypothetical protein
MAYSQTDIDNLKAALAKGIKRATVGGVTREFFSLEDMIALIALMEAEVNGKPQFRLAQFRSGFRRPWRRGSWRYNDCDD